MLVNHIHLFKLGAVMAVSIETRLRVGCSRVRMPVGARDFFFLQGVQSASGTRLGAGDIPVDNAAGA
jgi:hypothetical protein